MYHEASDYRLRIGQVKEILSLEEVEADANGSFEETPFAERLTDLVELMVRLEDLTAPAARRMRRTEQMKFRRIWGVCGEAGWQPHEAC